jgi:ATP-dependent helicase HepA
MGKSVEAGIIIRQLLIDDRKSRILIVVPDGLIAQWESELCSKFRLDDYRNRVEIAGHSTFSKDRDYSKVDLLVVDEVHNLVAKNTGSEEEEARAQLTLAAHSVARLLLLSATPLLHNEEIFLGMLHLLDPDLYRLGDLEEFTSRVRSKEEFALRLQAFDVGKSDWILETQAEAFQEIFPEDDVLHSLTSTLLAWIDGEREVDEQFNQLVRSIRTHLAETYRLHRRVLRTRRESPLGRDFPVRGRQYQSDHSEKNWGEVDDWLLDWLSEFSRRVQGGSTDSLAVTALLGLLERLQSLPSIAVSYCRYWRDSSDLGARQSAELTPAEGAALEATPLRAHESELLANLTELLDTPARDRLWLERVVADIRSLPTGSVVFCGFDQATIAVLGSIKSASGVTAAAIGHSDSAPNSYAQALTDVRDGNIGYLLCGREAEEGLNIQFAPAVLLAHLPWDPGRIEQRIGRADRFGQGDPVGIHVLSDTDFVTAVWAEFLADAFGAFQHSIASLQHQLSSWRDRAVTTLLEKGTTALRESTPEFREGLVEDLGRVLRIEALESIDSESRLGEQLFASMRSVDARPNEIKEVTDGWVLWKTGEQSVATLGFVSSGSGYKFRPIFSTIPLEYVRTQLEFGEVEFESGRSVPVSFAREASLNEESPVHLMRVGDPFFDGLVRLTNAVDLGQTFGFIRPTLNGHNWLIADVTFRLEGDAGAVRDALGLRLQGLDDEAVIRLLDSFFPPQTQRILLDQEGFFVGVDLEAELGDEFDGGHDRAIVTREIPFLEAKFGIDWVVWWEEIRDASMQCVNNSDSFRKAKQSALDKLDSVQTDLTHQLHLRQNSETSSLEISCLADELERQRVIWDAVRLGIERIVPIAEVAGVIVLAAEDFLEIGDLG